MQNSEVT